MTQWIITKEFIDSPEDVGTIGPRAAKMTGEQIINHPNAVRFRMKDGDNEVYYEGYMAGSDNLFAPLDDFGAPNAGCTSIEIWENGKWEIV